MNDHLRPVGNPAPPRPRSPDSFTVSVIAGGLSGVTDSRKSSLISTGVANPQAPKHSTSITVQEPSGLVAPSSFAPVASSRAFTTSSAPQMLQGDVVHTCTKFFPTGCWWYIV